MAVTNVQQVFRVRTDSTAAQGGTPTWGAAQNTNFNVAANTAFRIRFAISAQGSSGTASASTHNIFYSKNGGAYAQVPSTSSGNPVFSTDATAGASADNSAITTSLLTGATGTFSTVGQYDKTGATGSITIARGSYAELEFGLQFNSASITSGDIFTFRVYRNTSALDTYSVTPSFTVTYTDTGTLAVTEAADTLSAGATVTLPSGSLSATEAADTLSAGATVTLPSGTLAATEAADTLSAGGTVTLPTGSLSVTEAADTLSAGATVTLPAATLSITEADDALSAGGSITLPSGSLSATEADDTLSASATVTLPSGSLSITEDDDTLSASGTVATSSITGTLNVTEDDDALSAAGGPIVAGSLSVTEDVDGLSASGTTGPTLRFAFTVNGDTVSWSGGKVRQASILNATMTVRFSDGTTKQYKNVGYITFGALKTATDPYAFLKRLG